MWGLWKLSKRVMERRRSAREAALKAHAPRRPSRGASQTELPGARAAGPDAARQPLLEMDATAGDRGASAVAVGDGELAPKAFTIDLRFESLGLVLKGSRKVVMEGVTGGCPGALSFRVRSSHLRSAQARYGTVASPQ